MTKADRKRYLKIRKARAQGLWDHKHGLMPDKRASGKRRFVHWCKVLISFAKKHPEYSF